MSEDRLSFERKARDRGHSHVAGVDEAGRGPLAGPVMACACILLEGFRDIGIQDSKKLTAQKREEIYESLVQDSQVIYALDEASVEEIEVHNILRATLLAMKRAIDKLKVKPTYVLVDGNQYPPIDIPGKAIVQGDDRSLSIGAASILAKVARDRLMLQYHEKWPAYGFDAHKGYGTKKHMEALKKWGPLPIHRKDFEPIRSFFQP